MTGIRFVRDVTIQEHSRTYDLNELPTVLQPLGVEYLAQGVGYIYIDPEDITAEQNDALDDLLFTNGDELELGDTVSQQPFGAIVITD